jgi:nicotinate-nucleotide adenylyltransferase
MRARRRARTKIGIFGGTFDPIHSGHMAVARAALRRFRLDRIYFVPSGQPPHKPDRQPTAFLHRYTMVALACAGEPRFAPSLLEAGPDLDGRQRSYSIDTLRRMRRQYPRARLCFILGADQFLTLPTWKEYRKLTKLCEFIVASRPSFRLSARDAARIAPATPVHRLTTVQASVSSTAIRRRAQQGDSLRGAVPPTVEDYIRSVGLYQRSR